MKNMGCYSFMLKVGILHVRFMGQRRIFVLQEHDSMFGSLIGECLNHVKVVKL